MMDYYENLISNGMFTKDRFKSRFFAAAVNSSNLSQFRDRNVATLSVVYDCNECKLVYLEPVYSADVTYKRLTGGKFEYHSWSDIDRYLLKCEFGNAECDRCPAWKKLREILAVAGPDLASATGDRLFVRVEDNPAYGECGAMYVGDGDGAIGPIARDLRRCGRSPFDALALCCQSCEFKRLARNEDSVRGNPVGLPGEQRTVSADDDGDDDADGSDDVANADGGIDAHGGIIPFFKRLFGRGK